MNAYIDIIDEQFIEPTTTFCGIVNPAPVVTVAQKSKGTYTIPYIRIVEGTIFTDQTMFDILQEENIQVVCNGVTVFTKCKSEIDNFKTIENPSDYYNLYDADSKQALDNKLIAYEPFNNEMLSEMVYLTNTEEYHRLYEDVDTIAGVASGDRVAKIAYDNKIKNIIFYDYSYLSIKLQQSLIHSTNVEEVYIAWMKFLTTGQRPITIDDIKSLDIDSIQKYYDYLKRCKVSYMVCDIRKPKQLQNLLDECDENTALWLSNVYYYASSLYTDKEELFEMIDDSGVTVLPHIRVLYEG